MLISNCITCGCGNPQRCYVISLSFYHKKSREIQKHKYERITQLCYTIDEQGESDGHDIRNENLHKYDERNGYKMENSDATQHHFRDESEDYDVGYTPHNFHDEADDYTMEGYETSHNFYDETADYEMESLGTNHKNYENGKSYLQDAKRYYQDEAGDYDFQDRTGYQDKEVEARPMMPRKG